MAVSISCSCGAFLEIDEKFAGQVVQCPDCDKPLQVPAGDHGPLRTSTLALASTILALVGAFTVIGTIGAVVCGVFGWLAISREPKRLSGKKYAVAGIVMGVLFTALTLAAFASKELFGIESLLREQEWAGKLDYTGPAVITTKLFTIKRTSNWGVLAAEDDEKGSNPTPDELILVDPSRDAQIACLQPRLLDWKTDTSTIRKEAVAAFKSSRLLRILNHGKPTSSWPVEPSKPDVLKQTDKLDVYECLLEFEIKGHVRQFVMRIFYPKNGTHLHIVVGGTKKSHFELYEDHVRSVIASFRLK